MKNPDFHSENDLPEIHSPNARLGMILFVIYSLAYLGFMGMAVFALDTFAEPSPLGMNWALVYGMGLIIGAFVLAMVYMFLCKSESKLAEQKEGGAK